MSQLQKFHVYGAITKATEADDGTLTVEGIASTGTRDSAGEIVLPSAMKAALPAYTGAVREMHQSIAAGRAVKIFVDDDGITRITALVVDPGTVKKVKHKVLKGFSIGGKVLERDKADPRTITKLLLSEVSLVDVPANAQSVVELVKLDDADTSEAIDPITALNAALDKALAASDRSLNPVGPSGSDVAGRLAKLEQKMGRSPQVAELLKSLVDAGPVGALAKYMIGIEERVAHLEATPMPPRAAASVHAVRTVSKAADASPGDQPGPSPDDIAKALAALPEAERAHLLMKVALSTPMRVPGAG